MMLCEICYIYPSNLHDFKAHIKFLYIYFENIVDILFWTRHLYSMELCEKNNERL